MVADGLSRFERLNTEWTLPNDAFHSVLQWAGPLVVDLLASAVNHRLPRWVSLFPHLDAVACNCLGIDWNVFGAFTPSLQSASYRACCRSSRDSADSWSLSPPGNQPPRGSCFLYRDHRTTSISERSPTSSARQAVSHWPGISAKWTAFRFYAKHS